MNKTTFIYLIITGLLLFSPFIAKSTDMNDIKNDINKIIQQLPRQQRDIDPLKENVNFVKFWQGWNVKTVKLREILKNIKPIVDQINLELTLLNEQLDGQLFPNNQDDCHPDFYCFQDAVFYKSPPLNPEDEWETMAEAMIFKESIVATRLLLFAKWLTELKDYANWTKEKKIEIRKELLLQYNSADFEFFKSIFEPNSAIYNNSSIEETSLRNVLLRFYGLYRNRLVKRITNNGKEDINKETKELLNEFDNDVSKQDAPLLALIDTVSTVYLPHIGLGATSERDSLSDLFGKEAADLIVFKKVDAKPVPIRNWCWDKLDISENPRTFRLKGTIETDIKDEKLLEFLINNIEKTWSVWDLEIDLDSIVVNETPNGKNHMGLTLTPDWAYYDPNGPCGVIYIAQFRGSCNST